MPHVIIIIDQEIDRLVIEAGDNDELIQRLENLRTKAHAVDEKLERNSPPIPPFVKAAMHTLLENLQTWLEGAAVENEDFETQLDDYIVSLDQYDD